MQNIAAYPEMTVIRPSGTFNASNASEFQQRMATAISQTGYDTVLVDLEQVESMDSAGLIALIRALRLAQSLGKRFSLCSVSPSIRIVFELTQLDQAFEIFENKAMFEAAIA